MMKVVMYLRGVLAYDIFLLGECLYFEGCSEDYMYFSFLYLSYFILLYTSLVTIYWWHTLYLFLIIIYDDVCSYSPISPCIVSFLSLYTCFFLFAIFYFCFILRCLNKFCLKYFRNASYQSLSCHELSSCKFLQKLMLGLDFIVFNKWLWV